MITYRRVGTLLVEPPSMNIAIPQGAEGNSRHSDRNISLFSSWSG